MFNGKPPHRGPHPRLVPQPLFEVSAAERGGALVIRLEGELDLHQCPRLARALADARTGGADTLLLDIGDLTFLDVAGLELLLAESRRWADTGRSLMLTRGQGSVAKLVRITGLETMLPFAAEDSSAHQPAAAGMAVA